MYRLSSDLAPYVTHPDMPQFHNQIEECADELAAVGKLARQDDVRLSFHPGPHTVLNSPDEGIVEKAVADLCAQARILDLMGLGPEAVINVHVGGLYGDKPAAMARFVERTLALPENVRDRLVLENDERIYRIEDTYAIHQRTGVRLVLDQLHHLCSHSPGRSLEEALSLALSTWPADQTPKVHYSSPRTALIAAPKRTQSSDQGPGFRLPRLSQHADLIDPFGFVDFLRLAPCRARDFDVMLECKAKDVALLRLREQLARLAPDLAERCQIT
jgi:UV DNA damage endonuclease